MFTYVKVKSTGKVYILQISGWSSFCNGSIVQLIQVPAKEYDTVPRIQARNISPRGNISYYRTTTPNIKGLRDMVYRNLNARQAYVLMPSESARILTSTGKVFKKYSQAQYNIGDEEYTLFVWSKRLKATNHKAMVHKDRALLIKRTFMKVPYRNRLSRIKRQLDCAKNRKQIDTILTNVTMTDDYKINLTVHPKCISESNSFHAWGCNLTKSTDNIPYERHTKTSLLFNTYTISYMLPMTLSKDRGKDLDKSYVQISTGIRPTEINIEQKMRVPSGWSNRDYTEIPVGQSIIKDMNNDELLKALLSNIKYNITRRITTIQGDYRGNIPKVGLRRTTWLSDNMDANNSRRKNYYFNTGTTINLMLSENLKGNYSKTLPDGTVMYFHVCSLMAGNYNHDDHATFVAVVSLDPIKETTVLRRKEKVIRHKVTKPRPTPRPTGYIFNA